MNILGVSALYHDSAACLVRDGVIVAAAQEERFTRKKHDASIPRNAIAYVLQEGAVGPNGIDVVVFYDKPLTKLARLLATYVEVAPRGLSSFLHAIPSWLRSKGWVGYQLERCLRDLGFARPKDFQFTEHHQAHAASAFYPSPFDQAAVLTVDGVGEWATTCVSVGEGPTLKLLFEQRFPHSLGLLYSAFTSFCGFEVNDGEYKLMGLAPYGEPRFVDAIRDKLIDLREDGSFRLDLDYFAYLEGDAMTNARFAALFGGPPRAPDAELTARERDVARSVQVVLEEAMLKMARYARAVTGKRNLCLAGGVALNCVANGALRRSALFDDIWIQPAAGDAGGAVGAALYAWYATAGNARTVEERRDAMRGALLGPAYETSAIAAMLDTKQAVYARMSRPDRDARIAQALAAGKVVGVLQGRMELGPRALGSRSILADPRDSKMQARLNATTKMRESFRPFAPMVLEEDAANYFVSGARSPYMLVVDHLREDQRDLPAITHVDRTARVQTVNADEHPGAYGILAAFKALTGCSVLVNTSFNVRGEPIVCTPEDAYRCYLGTDIDMLVLEDLVLEKV